MFDKFKSQLAITGFEVQTLIEEVKISTSPLIKSHGEFLTITLIIVLFET